MRREYQEGGGTAAENKAKRCRPVENKRNLVTCLENIKTNYIAVIRHCENVDTSKVKKERDVRGCKDEMM